MNWVARRKLIPIHVSLPFLGAQRRTKELLVFYFWAQLFGFLWVLVLFWADIIPGFGQASSIEDFFLKLNQALACHFGIIDDATRGCDKVPLIFVLNTFSYVGADVFLICLMAVSEGRLTHYLRASLVVLNVSRSAVTMIPS